MRDYGLAAPHGPNMGGEHVATADLSNMKDGEASVFRSLLLPDDSYDQNGTYWADMPLRKRVAFVNKVDSEEAKKELKAIGSMMKADPLSPVSFYFRNMVIPGMGLLLEGCVDMLFDAYAMVLTQVQICSLFDRKRQASLHGSLP